MSDSPSMRGRGAEGLFDSGKKDPLESISAQVISIIISAMNV
jgi:hypothetical protein